MDIADAMADLSVAPEAQEGTERSNPGQRGMHRAVFLDRDGVLNVDTVHLHRSDEMRLIDGVPKALSMLREMDLKIVVVTNQAGIAKGLFDHRDFLEVMASIRRDSGLVRPWDRVYFCPFSEEGVVERYVMPHIDRKPNPGMLLRAALEMDLDLPSSIMIGDHIKDVQAAHRAGCKGVLVMTGKGKDELKKLIEDGVAPGDERWPDLMAQDLLTASRAIEEGAI